MSASAAKPLSSSDPNNTAAQPINPSIARSSAAQPLSRSTTQPLSCSTTESLSPLVPQPLSPKISALNPKPQDSEGQEASDEEYSEDEGLTSQPLSPSAPQSNSHSVLKSLSFQALQPPCHTAPQLLTLLSSQPLNHLTTQALRPSAPQLSTLSAPQPLSPSAPQPLSPSAPDQARLLMSPSRPRGKWLVPSPKWQVLRAERLTLRANRRKRGVHSPYTLNPSPKTLKSKP